MAPKAQGVVAYGVTYRWFTDASGPGLAEQARRQMRPDPPKKEEELAGHVEMWHDKIGRLAAHGEEYKLAPVFKISALRMLMTGKAKEHFDHGGCQVVRGAVSESQGLLAAEKLDSSVKEQMQHRGDPWMLQQ